MNQNFLELKRETLEILCLNFDFLISLSIFDWNPLLGVTRSLYSAIHPSIDNREYIESAHEWGCHMG